MSWPCWPCRHRWSYRLHRATSVHIYISRGRFILATSTSLDLILAHRDVLVPSLDLILAHRDVLVPSLDLILAHRDVLVPKLVCHVCTLLPCLSKLTFSQERARISESVRAGHVEVRANWLTVPQLDPLKLVGFKIFVHTCGSLWCMCLLVVREQLFVWKRCLQRNCIRNACKPSFLLVQLRQATCILSIEKKKTKVAFLSTGNLQQAFFEIQSLGGGGGGGVLSFVMVL